MKKESDKFVFVCNGLRVGDKIPCANVLFFTDEEEAKPEMETCLCSHWEIQYKGCDFKEAAKTLKSIEEQGYLIDDIDREILNSYL